MKSRLMRFLEGLELEISTIPGVEDKAIAPLIDKINKAKELANNGQMAAAMEVFESE